jgi:hypothetical protein
MTTAGDEHQAECVLAKKVERTKQFLFRRQIKAGEQTDQRERQSDPGAGPPFQRRAFDRATHGKRSSASSTMPTH